MKILIADDETPIREWIQFSIERGANPDFEIAAVAENGKDALEQALKHHVDIVITDIKMPGMDGLELMKKVLEVMPYTNFIILTNYAEFSYAREAITYGAKKYFLKSELRGKDILSALEEISKKHKEKLENTELNRYSNGYLDIFDCYYNIDNKKFISDFWKKHHFCQEDYFVVIAFEKEDCRKQKMLIDTFLKRANVHGLGPAMKNKSIYFIMQAGQKDELLKAADDLGSLFTAEEQRTIVSGRIEQGIDKIMDSIEEAEKMLRYTFIFSKGYLKIQDMETVASLDRAEIKNNYYKILNSILYESEDIIQKEIEKWYENFQKVSFSDISWAREICINLVMRIEEICEEHFSDFAEEHSAEVNWSLEQCKTVCCSLMKKLYYEEDFQYSQSIRDAIRFIHENYTRDISLNEVAQYVYRSPEYFSRLFKSETGKNFSSYLMTCRLDKAKDLLLNTDMKIYEIAYAVGYTTPSYFSKMYRKYMGVTPDITRNQRKNIK